MPLINVLANEPADLVATSSVSVAFEDIGKALLEFYAIYQQALAHSSIEAQGFTVEIWPGRLIFIDNPSFDDFFQREKELCAQITFSSFERWWSDEPKRPVAELVDTVRGILISTQFADVIGNKPVMVMPFDDTDSAVRL